MTKPVRNGLIYTKPSFAFCVVQSEYLQVRKHRKTACQFAKDVPHKVISYHDVEDSGGPIPSVNECPIFLFFVLANGNESKTELTRRCDHNAPQLRGTYKGVGWSNLH